MLYFSNSQINRAIIRFGPSELMLLPVSVLNPFEFLLDLATQAQFDVKNKVITMVTKRGQTMVKASRRANRGAWKLKINIQLSNLSEVD